MRKHRDVKTEWLHEGRTEEKREQNKEKETEMSGTNWDMKSAVSNSEIRVSWVLLDPEVQLVSVIILVKYILVNFSALLSCDWY